MPLFTETQPSSPQARPIKSALATAKSAWEKHRELSKAIAKHVNGSPEDVKPLLHAAMSHVSAMHAFGYIDINGYGNRLEALGLFCRLVLDNHDYETSEAPARKALSAIGLLREEAMRRLAIAREEMMSDDEADEAPMLVDENHA